MKSQSLIHPKELSKLLRNAGKSGVTLLNWRTRGLFRSNLRSLCLPYDLEPGHILILGDLGSGRIEPIKSILHTALIRNDKIIAFDPKRLLLLPGVKAQTEPRPLTHGGFLLLSSLSQVHDVLHDLPRTIPTDPTKNSHTWLLFPDVTLLDTEQFDHILSFSTKYGVCIVAATSNPQNPAISDTPFQTLLVFHTTNPHCYVTAARRLAENNGLFDSAVTVQAIANLPDPRRAKCIMGLVSIPEFPVALCRFEPFFMEKARISKKHP